ncbi:PhoU domain protein [Natrialba magadii ATCC 43099]|uniref:PhoU domain protein n=1 Tax=Natrialba magadii (strain ATCC 43099 / DSM 3394 / CCM 3739 / CIP 104546 / IAM 13178 / JCM 8861 / NBRC 102185 / NCIMB 2190 / MS3) TaxID=547559 RepID=D3SXH6_NATMM|nr:phosphate uptake regulator PhoU [Natrialba magadii]ADD05925.1 PhoU domain protein [Natrialba magadii ATCC 43099]ELY30568.1 phosphate uptake regulator PhoU [Natrialba magadii ATCC 43099]
MKHEELTLGLADPVERKIQMAGNSTFVVSLPKSWAVEQDLEPGMSMYLYPHADRLVAAPETASVQDRTVTIDADTAAGDIALRRVEVAYKTGFDRITVTNLEETDSRLRRMIERSTSRLIGLTIQEDTGDSLTITNVLDASDVSLPQTITQAQQLVTEMYTDAITALVTGDEDLANRVLTRDDDINRLFAFVCRGFHRGLEDVHEVEQLGTDRVAAFREYRVARSLERIAAHAERIAAVATQQAAPPEESFAEQLELVAADVRAVLELALEGDAESAYETATAVEPKLDDLDQSLYSGTVPNAYLYGAVIRRLRQTTTNGRFIADTMTESTLLDRGLAERGSHS